MPPAPFVAFSECVAEMRGKRVAVVGSGPSVLQNAPGFIEAHDVVVRVNNYQTSPEAGMRCDIFYSFFGSSIKKRSEDLKRNGVRLCMSKLPNSKPIESAWHEERKKYSGVDYRYVYTLRADWWFCPVFVPDDARFLAKFELLGKHQPTTGFAAILDVLECEPAECYLTGFDFFRSGLHNVSEKWRAINPDDPIKHTPEAEAAWIKVNAHRYPLKFDRKLTRIIEQLQ